MVGWLLFLLFPLFVYMLFLCIAISSLEFTRWSVYDCKHARLNAPSWDCEKSRSTLEPFVLSFWRCQWWCIKVVSWVSGSGEAGRNKPLLILYGINVMCFRWSSTLESYINYQKLLNHHCLLTVMQDYFMNICVERIPQGKLFTYVEVVEVPDNWAFAFWLC